MPPAPAPAFTRQEEEEVEEEETYYDDIEIEDMTFDPATQLYHYPCPCGDRFEIALAALRDGEHVAVCPSCSLMIRVVFDVDDLPKAEGEGETAVREKQTTQQQVALVAA